MKRKIMFSLTLLLSGRAMTLGYLHRIGGTLPGDPPAAWLMPLVGDAIIGITALGIAYVILKTNGLWAWTVIIVWNFLAIWDAMSAFLIHTTNPWPEFFMIKLFGPAMFFAASAMHLALIVLAGRSDVRKSFQV